MPSYGVERQDKNSLNINKYSWWICKKKNNNQLNLNIPDWIFNLFEVQPTQVEAGKKKNLIFRVIHVISSVNFKIFLNQA